MQISLSHDQRDVLHVANTARLVVYGLSLVVAAHEALRDRPRRLMAQSGPGAIAPLLLCRVDGVAQHCNESQRLCERMLPLDFRGVIDSHVFSLCD